MNPQMNQSSQKDFAWYQQSASVKPVEKVVQPTKTFDVKPTSNLAYNRVIHQAVDTARQQVLQQPTIISIDSQNYSAPIQIISMTHEKPTEQLMQQSAPVLYTQEPTVDYNEQLPANDSTKSSLFEETEPLLDHSWKDTTDSLTNNIGIVDDMGLSDTLGASELKESTGFAEGSTSNLDDLSEIHTENANPELESSIQIMKRNSIKLDTLNFLDNSDLESGSQFDSGVADLVNLDYKGDQSTLAEADETQEKALNELDDMILDGDKWNFFYSRRTPVWVIEAEEQERMERTARGQSPELLGKWHRVQRELMMTRFPYSTSAYVVEKVAEKAVEAKEAVAETVETVIEKVSETTEGAKEVVSDTFEHMHETFAESTNLLTSGISGMLHWGAETTSNLVGTAKASLGIYKAGSIPYINALEEKERLSRLNAKVDPVVDAKKRHVELELMSAIKPAC